MDGFTGFKTAAAEELPDAVTVMDPFHVVKLATDTLDETRRRVQQQIFGRRGRKQDPLFIIRKVLLTSTAYLSAVGIGKEPLQCFVRGRGPCPG